MSSTRRAHGPRWLLALLALAVAFTWAPAMLPDIDAESLSVRERWTRLSPEEREGLRARYEAYQLMSDSEQRELAERALNVRSARERLMRRLTDAQRQSLQALDERTRAALLSEMVEDDLRQQGRRLHAMIPEEWRERIEQGSPEERRRFLVEFKERHRPRLSLVAIERLGRLLGKTESELQAWKREPESERLARIVVLHKEVAARSIAESGLPAGLSAQRWDEIQELAPEDFYDEVQRLSRQLAPRPDAAAPADSFAERRRAAVLEILATFQASPNDRIELSHLSPAERRAEIAARRRARLQAVLEDHEALPPEILAQFRAMSDDDFHAGVRRIVRESGVQREPALGSPRAARAEDVPPVESAPAPDDEGDPRR